MTGFLPEPVDVDNLARVLVHSKRKLAAKRPAAKLPAADSQGPALPRQSPRQPLGNQMNYVHIQDRPAQLTRPWVADQHGDLQTRLEAAEEAAEAGDWLRLFEDWNALKSYIESEYARLCYAFTKDMTDAAAEEAERLHREEITPEAEKGDARLVAALLASKHRGAISERFGAQLLRVLAVVEETLAPMNSELRVQVGDLATRYDKLCASGEVDIQGERMTLARARGRLSSSDSAARRAAYEAYNGWFIEQRDVLAGIYAEQVELRDQMGRNLGYDNFVPLGYSTMQRTDYGPAEAATFRGAVRQYAAPLHERLAQEQASLLGQESLRPWDVGFHPELTLPLDVAEPIASQLDKLARVFDRLSPRLARHFARMRKEGLIDLENRKGKGAGAYCTAFTDEERAAIFCNSTGDESDIGTLTHEMGHAFQAWESQWIEAIDLRWPSSDACEIHSMGMEYLTLPYLGEFFTDEQSVIFSRGRFRRAVTLMCYVCVVDEFQHWVYEHPKATPADRDSEFIRLQSIYMPGVDWSGDAEAFRATRWYAQLHIFDHPFYYIDYAIAETGAMQLSLMDAVDHDACLETYYELCRLGGSKSLLQLLAGAGLRSPFDPNLVKDLMAHAAGKLGV